MSMQQQPTCSVANCEKPHLARGLCRTHYQRWWKRGSVDLAPGYEPRTTRERFEAKVVRSDLEPVSKRVNVLRGEGTGARIARRSACSRGHVFDEANTRMYRGARTCRACERDRSRLRAGQGGR